MTYNLKSSIWDKYYKANTESNKRSASDRVESQIAGIEKIHKIGERTYSIHHDNTQTTISISDDFDVRNLTKRSANLQDQDVYRVTVRADTRPNVAHPLFLKNLLGHQNFTKIH